MQVICLHLANTPLNALIKQHWNLLFLFLEFYWLITFCIKQRNASHRPIRFGGYYCKTKIKLRFWTQKVFHQKDRFMKQNIIWDSKRYCEFYWVKEPDLKIIIEIFLVFGRTKIHLEPLLIKNKLVSILLSPQA